MYMKFRRECQLTVPEKITVLGLRIEAGRQPGYEIKEKKLTVKDTWSIQIVYKPFGSNYQVPPSLMEIPYSWEEEFEWDKGSSDGLSVSYHKPPHSTLYQINEEKRLMYFLHLIAEGVLAIDYAQNEVRIIASSQQEPVKEEMVPAGADKNLEEIMTKLDRLEHSYAELCQQLKTLMEKTNSLQEKPVSINCNIGGYVLDGLRLVPVAKTIIEFYQNNEEEPVLKTATDNRGFYSCDQLVPGTYDIKIKHPRFSPLVIKDYSIKAGENKYQDFLLRR